MAKSKRKFYLYRAAGYDLDAQRVLTDTVRLSYRRQINRLKIRWPRWLD